MGGPWAADGPVLLFHTEMATYPGGVELLSNTSRTSSMSTPSDAPPSGHRHPLALHCDRVGGGQRLRTHELSTESPVV